MNKKVAKELQHRANEFLSDIYEPVLVPYRKLGRDILFRNPNAKDKKGNPIEPMQFYTLFKTEQKKVGVDTLKKAYKIGGWPRVDHVIRSLIIFKNQ